MKRIAFLIVLLCMANMVSASMLVNGDFETGDTSGWFSWGGNAAIINEATQPLLPRIGTTAVTLWWSDAGWGQIFDAAPGDSFTYSGMVNVYEPLVDRNATLKVEFWDGNGDWGIDNLLDIQSVSATPQEVVPASPINDWLNLSITAVAPEGTTKIKVLCVYDDYGSPAGKAAFDNLVLVPEPLSMMLLGLGSLAVIRRKR